MSSDHAFQDVDRPWDRAWAALQSGLEAFKTGPAGTALGQIQALIEPAALQRLTLLINHIIGREPAAQARLMPHAGRRLRVSVLDLPSLLPGLPSLSLLITPAGLLEWEPPNDMAAPADLQVRVQVDNPLAVGWAALNGQWPAMQVEGDAALAADVNWLAQNLRWDVADDLHRLFGPGPAQFLSSGAGQLAAALQAFVQGLSRQAGPLWDRFRPGDKTL